MTDITDLRSTVPRPGKLTLDSPAPSHPHPTKAEAKERGKMRQAASDGLQSVIWIGVLAVLAGLVIGATIYLSGRSPAGNEPALPAAAPRN